MAPPNSSPSRAGRLGAAVAAALVFGLLGFFLARREPSSSEAPGADRAATAPSRTSPSTATATASTDSPTGPGGSPATGSAAGTAAATAAGPPPGLAPEAPWAGDANLPAPTQLVPPSLTPTGLTRSLREAAVLSGARSALAVNPVQALSAARAADGHDRGPLAQDWQALEIAALYRTGQSAAGDQAATAFLARHADGPHAADVRRRMALPKTSPGAAAGKSPPGANSSPAPSPAPSPASR